jgi:hypothetical protein
MAFSEGLDIGLSLRVFKFAIVMNRVIPNPEVAAPSVVAAQPQKEMLQAAAHSGVRP